MNQMTVLYDAFGKSSSVVTKKTPYNTDKGASIGPF